MTSDLRHPTSGTPARVLIVDDHAIVRYGMGALLSGADDLTLCGEADTYDEALTAIRELKPDVAVIDIILHDRSGLDLIREIRGQESEVRGQESGVRGQGSTQQPATQQPSNPTTNRKSSIGNRQCQCRFSSCPCTTNPPMLKKRCAPELRDIS